MNDRPQPADVKAAAQAAEDAAAQAVEQAKKRSVRARADDEVINDDERQRFVWQSRYPPDAIKRIRIEAAYVVILFFASLLGLLLTWTGDVYSLLNCPQCSSVTFSKYAYLFLSGVLGGCLFGLKYLYKVVARGWWNLDRELWRFSSPWLSGGMAFGVGVLANAGLFGFTVGNSPSGASFVSLGFIAGYFADSASRKMQEIADTLFGNPRDSATKSGRDSGNDQANHGG